MKNRMGREIANISNNHRRRNFEIEDLSKPSDKVKVEGLSRARNMINGQVGKKTEAAYASSCTLKANKNTEYIRYTPDQSGEAFNSGAQQRIVKMVTQQEDPLLPPKFKHKRAPRGAPSPPETVMRSPSRKITAKDQADWNIPSCISQWKNAKGYTIPLHMRIQSDGRNLQDTTINHKHAKFSESILLAEIQSRKEVEERNKIKQSHHLMMEIRKEKQIQKDATLARAEKEKLIQSSISQLRSERRDNHEGVESRKRTREEIEREEAKRERDALKRQIKRDVVRQRRLEVAGKQDKANPRDGERDISEKIALGQAQPTSKDAMFDQRLFNQQSGMEQGFGDDDEYNLYDKPLFADRTATSIYKSTKEVNEEEDLEDTDKNRVAKVLKTTNKPNRGFEGADYTKGPRCAPVEFEQKNDSTDVNTMKAGLQTSHKRRKYDE
ncbi:unnamed protein product [Moneuplotes crassus]|uniref:SKI-interacting protein SKIP SNW domain-containing protein n=2 Tax=Euplotes crassus TaxID=5936 RepID=A0AAD1UPK0_EUPCR|nr:unnamed protein product [Moneuplotes crassus]